MRDGELIVSKTDLQRNHVIRFTVRDQQSANTGLD